MSDLPPKLVSLTAAPQSTLVSIRRTSTSHQLYEQLRERIISLELPPGMQLSRNELAEAYGVSQTPVRDALQMLEKEGLVIVYPQSRTEVTRINLRQSRETQFLRLALELEVVRKLVVEHGPQALDQPLRLVQLQETAINIDQDIERFSLLDRQFHHTMFLAADLSNLWDLVRSRSGHIDRLRKLNLMDPGKAATILMAHREIVEQMRTRNLEGAQHAVRQHLSGTLARVDMIRQAHPQYF